MKKFEYKIVYCCAESMLNEYGLNGWELAICRPDNRLIFKREIREPQPAPGDIPEADASEYCLY